MKRRKASSAWGRFKAEGRPQKKAEGPKESSPSVSEQGGKQVQEGKDLSPDSKRL